jgi:hypothetical protein
MKLLLVWLVAVPAIIGSMLWLRAPPNGVFRDGDCPPGIESQTTETRTTCRRRSASSAIRPSAQTPPSSSTPT